MADANTNKKDIDHLHNKVETMEDIIKDLRGQNETVKQALVDIAVALEKIANMEDRIQAQRNEAKEHNSKIQDIESRLPMIEQTVNWINKGLIGVLGVLGVLFMTYLINNIDGITSMTPTAG